MGQAAVDRVVGGGVQVSIIATTFERVGGLLECRVRYLSCTDDDIEWAVHGLL